MSSTDTWECGHSWDGYTLRFLPMWLNLKSSGSTCAWSVTLELSAFSREKAFQAPFDLFSIWLTLLWTYPMRFPTSLALLFQHTWTTCLLDLVPSQHASSPSAFATAHSENEKQALEGGSGSLSAEPVGPPHPVWVTYWSQCAALSWAHRRAFMVRWDSNECLWALSGSQRAGTIPAFTATLMGLPLVVSACFDLCSDTGCLSVCVWICDLHIPSCVYH